MGKCWSWNLVEGQYWRFWESVFQGVLKCFHKFLDKVSVSCCLTSFTQLVFLLNATPKQGLDEVRHVLFVDN